MFIISLNMPYSNNLLRIFCCLFALSSHSFPKKKHSIIKDKIVKEDYENVYESGYSKIQTPCSDLWRRMFVWWDGKVNPCDTDYKSELSVGDIKNTNISKLWQSNEYNNLRKQHESKLRKNLSPCNKCVLV